MRSMTILAAATGLVALVVAGEPAQKRGRRAQEKQIASKGGVEPKAKALFREAQNAAQFREVTPTRQIPGRSYEAYVRLPFQRDVTRVRYRVTKSGEAVFEGDMVLGEAEEIQRKSVEYERLLKDPQAREPVAAATEDFARLWPGGVVPYQISGDFSKKAIDAIEQGVAQLNGKTNVRVIPYDKKAHKDYVDVVVLDDDDPAGGMSHVGRQDTRKRQRLWLRRDVDGPSTVVHELMHTLGFHHEHTRADRDQYVEVRLRNVLQDESVRDNFRVFDGSFAFDAYDQASIMHYDGFAFAKPCDVVRFGNGESCGLCSSMEDFVNRSGRCYPTILDRKSSQPVVRSAALSSQDVAAVNALYPAETPGTRLPPVTSLRSLRTTVERVITREGPGESGICGTKPDYIVLLQSGPAASVPGVADNRFVKDQVNHWPALKKNGDPDMKPVRSSDFRPNWRLVTPISPNAELVRVDLQLYDHDDVVCGGKDDVVDVSPTRYAFLRLLIDTSSGDIWHLDIADSPLPDLKTFPQGSRIGSIYDPSKGEFVILKFNGLQDGKSDYTDEAEVQLKIEILG